jgi:hypothetical protein
MSVPNTIEVVAVLKYEDLRRAVFQIARAATNWKRSLFVSIGLSMLLFPAVSLAYGDGANLFWITVIGIGFGVLLWIVITPLMLLIAYAISFLTARTLLRNNPNIQGSCTYRFSESGYSFVGPHSRGDILWAALLKIQETGDLFLLYPQKNFAYVIPKHCFTPEGEVEKMKQLLRDYYKGTLVLFT